MRYLIPGFFLLVLNCFGQEQPTVDFKTAKITLERIKSGHLSGTVVYKFKVNKDTETIFLNAKNMAFSTVRLNKESYSHKYLDDKLYIYHSFEKESDYQLLVKYAAFPEQAIYFMERGDNFSLKKRDDNSEGQVWTQGQGKYTSHWLPSIDDMNDKIEFDMSIKAAPQFQVVANGQLQPQDSIGDFYRYWKFDMTNPMSSYLAAFVIGDFAKEVITSSSGVPIELYYEPKDSLMVEPTYRYSKEIFDFLEDEIGVAYPWQNYKQVPVQDFLYAGMENTTCTIFSNQYVIDSTAFVDKNYVNVNAHELAHQWFGNLVTEVSGEHHWLHEGFATYYAYLTERELFGENHFYWKLYETAKTLHNISENGDGEALTDPKAGSLTFYEKGAWALTMLREKVGEGPFKKGIKNYLTSYAYKNATIADFLIEMEKASNQNLSSFRKEWLENVEFPWNEVQEYLEANNPSLKAYFDVQRRTDSTTVINEEKLKEIWKQKTPKEFKRQFIFDYWEQITDAPLREILIGESVEVRQAVAIVLPNFSRELQIELESLLSDPSYVTQEATLFKLWEAFPENRASYLDVTKDIEGLPNKNVRLLWLALAMVTPEYEISNKMKFEKELKGYTASHFNFEIRQGAFQYLSLLGQFDVRTLRNLIQACDHHVWQFKKSSRNLLRQLYGHKNGETLFKELQSQLSEEEKSILEKVINS